MNKWYVDIYGGESITIEELMRLPDAEYVKLMEAVTEAENAGEKRSVETRDTKKKDSNR